MQASLGASLVLSKKKQFVPASSEADQPPHAKQAIDAAFACGVTMGDH